MADPTGTMKISFAVSATPKVDLDKSEGFYQAQTVIHEDVRTSVGGSGEITSTDAALTVTGGWVNGVNTPVASATSPVSLSVDTSSDLVCIKHLGVLASDGTTASAAADTLLIQTTSGTHIIAELKNNEAIVLPRPRVDISIKTGNASNHVNAQITVLGT